MNVVSVLKKNEKINRSIGYKAKLKSKKIKMNLSELETQSNRSAELIIMEINEILEDIVK